MSDSQSGTESTSETGDVEPLEIPEDAMPVVRAIRACCCTIGPKAPPAVVLFLWGSFAERFHCTTLAMNTFTRWLIALGWDKSVSLIWPEEDDRGYRHAPLDVEDLVLVSGLYEVQSTKKAIGFSLEDPKSDPNPRAVYWVMRNRIHSSVQNKDTKAQVVEMARGEAVRLGFVPPGLP